MVIETTLSWLYSIFIDILAIDSINRYYLLHSIHIYNRMFEFSSGLYTVQVHGTSANMVPLGAKQLLLNFHVPW